MWENNKNQTELIFFVVYRTLIVLRQVMQWGFLQNIPKDVYSSSVENTLLTISYRADCCVVLHSSERLNICGSIHICICVQSGRWCGTFYISAKGIDEVFVGLVLNWPRMSDDDTRIAVRCATHKRAKTSWTHEGGFAVVWWWSLVLKEVYFCLFVCIYVLLWLRLLRKVGLWLNKYTHTHSHIVRFILPTRSLEYNCVENIYLPTT